MRVFIIENKILISHINKHYADVSPFLIIVYITFKLHQLP